MTMIGRLWNSVFRKDDIQSEKQVQTRTLAKKPADAQAAEPTDTFSFSVIKSPILAEIEQMAREMSPKQAPQALAPLRGDALGDYWQSLGEVFDDSYTRALDQKLQARGLDPLTTREQASIARSFEIVSQKLGAKVAVSTAGEVMKSKMSQDQIQQLEANTLNNIELSPMPVAYFENAPVHVGKRVSVAASGPAGIYLNPYIHSIPASPYKSFVLGHEKNHVDTKDGVASVGIMLLKTNLQSAPNLLGAAEKAEGEISREREFAADRAGTDTALKSYSPDKVESELKDMLSVVTEEQSASHPATSERIENITAHIRKRVTSTDSHAPKTVAFQNVFSSPIFDELAEMAKTL